MSYYANLDVLTKTNENYRKVLHTTKDQQLVLMSIPYNEEIGMEVHPSTTQFIKIEQGSCIVIIGKEKLKLKKGMCIVVNPNTYHNVISKSKKGLKLYTIYSPPEHKPNLVQKYKPKI